MIQVARMKQKKMPLVILEPEHAHGKGIYSNMNFDYGQLIKGSPLHTSTLASHLTLMEQDTPIGLTR